MWVKCNPNPVGRETGDCVIRAIAIATNQSWRETYRDLCRIGEIEGDLPNANWILSHSIKSLVTTCAMLEAEDDDGGYSGRYMPTWNPGITYGRDRRDGGNSYENRDGNSGNRGGYSRNRYSRENRIGYSRTGDMHDQLREMMEDAPDDVTRMEIKKLMDKMDQR